MLVQLVIICSIRYSSRGVVKYSSDCAPNNGYYFIPLQEDGDYTLKIESPQGWTFDPPQVDFYFDGETDVCSQQNDINFVFKGFAIFGKVMGSCLYPFLCSFINFSQVKSVNSPDGPSGVSLSLLSKVNNDLVIKQNITEPGGSFQLNQVLPGQYIIQVNQPNWKFSKKQIEVEVLDRVLNIDDSIQVLGYSVSGKVQSDDTPISGVRFLLAGKGIKNVNDLECSKTVDAVSKALPLQAGFSFLCSSLSDESGNFKFNSVPNGQYIVYTFYEAQNVRFELLPSSYSFEVSHSDLKLEQTFTIGGFTIFGQIVNKLKTDDLIENVRIDLIDLNDASNKFHVDSLDQNGRFRVDNIKSSRYVFKVSSPNYVFPDVTHYIFPNSSNIPAISPSEYKVCGKLLYTKSDSRTNQAVLSVSIKGDPNVLHQINVDGQDFCLNLPGNTYSFELSTSDQNVKFSPSSQDVVVNRPKFDVVFTQFTATVSGQIKWVSDLKFPSDDKLAVALTGSQAPKRVSTLKKRSDQTFSFVFEDVLPGEYLVSIDGPQSDWFCWEKSTLPVQVESSNVANINFVLKGVLAQFSLSHPSDLNVISPTGKSELLKKDSSGNNLLIRHCLSELGHYTVQPVGCFNFGPNNSVSFNTKSDFGRTINLIATEHLISFQVVASTKISDLSVQVNVQQGENTKSFILSDSTNLFSFYEKPNSLVTIQPVSGSLIFKPSSYKFEVKNDCYENIVTFVGNLGIFIHGQISQKISDVSISVFDELSGELLMEGKTGSDGKYSLGPFTDDIKLRIEAHKEGYVFKQVPSKIGNFDVQKFSSITISVTDESGSALNNVLVTLSGGENNFRKNSFVDSDGSLAVTNLYPGDYFIRFTLKEYEFEPSSKMLTLKDGNNVSVKTVGKKVAFSAYGYVQSLNEEPQSGIVVEAVGVKNLADPNTVDCLFQHEVAQSEQDGSFRILGLLPQCEYAIQLKVENQPEIKEFVPRQYIKRVSNQDIHDLRFIVYYAQHKTDVSFCVHTTEDKLPSLSVSALISFFERLKICGFLQVSLFLDNDSGTPIHKAQLSKSAFVFLPALPLNNSRYVLKLSSNLCPRTYKKLVLTKSFVTNQSFLHFDFHFDPVLRSSSKSNSLETDAEQTSNLIVVPIVLVGTLIFFYNKLFFESQLVQSVQNLFTKSHRSESKGDSSESSRKRNKLVDSRVSKLVFLAVLLIVLIALLAAVYYLKYFRLEK